jgi:1-acyl-sn-glycerol-3-phosphate acyltransferase
MLQDPRVSLSSLLSSPSPTPALPPPSDLCPGVPLEDVFDSTFRDRVLRSRWAKQTEVEMLEPPLPSAMEAAAFRAKFARTLAAHAPVVVGSENLPDVDPSRPVLFISNHTLIGYLDAVILMDHLLEHKNVLLKSLAHPVLFQSVSAPRDDGKPRQLRLPGIDPVSLDELRRFGIIPVSPRGLVKELARNNWTLMFPGGAREALKRKTDSKYSLHWPENQEFVRTAAALGALIIPVSTVGQEDSVNIVLDGQQVRQGLETVSRVSGRNLLSPPRNTTGDADPTVLNARQWQGVMSDEDLGELFPPFVVPSTPDRIYLRIGRPIHVPSAARRDKVISKQLYDRVRSEVAEGVQELLAKRKGDVYRTPASRLALRVKHGDIGPPAAGAAGWMWETLAGPLDESSCG